MLSTSKIRAASTHRSARVLIRTCAIRTGGWLWIQADGLHGRPLLTNFAARAVTMRDPHAGGVDRRLHAQNWICIPMSHTRKAGPVSAWGSLDNCVA
jgi:hypothetical protein